MTTPNRSFYEADVLWETEPPPVHLWWFSEEGLYRMADRLACDIELIDFTDFYKDHLRMVPTFFPSNVSTRDSVIDSDRHPQGRSTSPVARLCRWLRWRSFFVMKAVDDRVTGRRLTDTGPVLGVIMKKRHE